MQDGKSLIREPHVSIRARERALPGESLLLQVWKETRGGKSFDNSLAWRPSQVTWMSSFSRENFYQEDINISRRHPAKISGWNASRLLLWLFQNVYFLLIICLLSKFVVFLSFLFLFFALDAIIKEDFTFLSNVKFWFKNKFIFYFLAPRSNQNITKYVNFFSHLRIIARTKWKDFSH